MSKIIGVNAPHPIVRDRKGLALLQPPFALQPDKRDQTLPGTEAAIDQSA